MPISIGNSDRVCFAPPSPKNTPKKSIFQKTNSKISQVSRKIFYLIFFWKKPFKLTPRDMRLLGHSSYQFMKKPASVKNPTVAPSGKGRPLSQGIALPFINLDHPKIFEVKPSMEFDPALKQMRDFFGDFASKIFECYYDQYAKKSFDNYQLDVLPEKLKEIAKFLVQIGNKSSKPIFKLMDEKDPLLDQLLDKGKTGIDSSLENIILWLVEGEKLENISKELKKRLHKVPKPSWETLESHYVSPLLKWFFNPKSNAHPLEGVKIDQATFECVREEIILLLIEKKIDVYFQLVQTTIGKQNFFQLLHHMSSKNVKKTTDILSDRLALLINYADYPTKFNEVIQQFATHVESLLEVKQILNQKVNLGDIPVATEKAFSYEFAKQKKACHPTVKEIIIAKDGPNLAVLSEMEYYSSLAERLIEVLCPPQIVYTDEGHIVERDGVACLWDQVVIPQEFTQLIQKGLRVMGQIVSPDFMKVIEHSQGTLIAYIEEIVVKLAKKETKKFIVEKLKDLVHRLTTPSRRDELFAVQILPQVSHFLIFVYIRQIISSSENLKEIACMFEGIGNQTAEILPEKLPEMKKKFNELVKLNLGHTLEELLVKYQIGPTKFDALYTTLITDMQMQWHKNPEESALQCFTKFFASPQAEKNELYGKLIINLVFEIGQLEAFPGSKTLAHSAKDGISSLISKALENISSSHQLIISTIIQGSANTYNTKENVHELLFGDAKPLTSEEKELALEKELSLISLLAYKSICFSVKHNVLALGEFFVPKQEAIHSAIRKIYNEILKPMPLKSLLFTVTSTAAEALQKASNQIQREKDQAETKKISEDEKEESGVNSTEKTN